MRPPTVYGAHQPGIATPHRKHGLIAAFDFEDLHILTDWTRMAESLMRTTGATITIGLGPSLFDDRFGLARHRPAGLRPLPPVDGDALDPALGGGDACVLIGADEPIDLPDAFGTPRWVQRGTRNDRGALGFRDGTLNLRRPVDLDRHVWVSSRERSWMVGGTFLVVRRIQVLDSWHALAEPEQEQVIGRDKRTGAPLTGRRLYDPPILHELPENAHIRVAAPREANVALLRRGYDTDDGLLFLAFQRDPRRQFVPLQRRLTRHDALHAHTRHIGSAVFAIPPGARPSESLAQALLYSQ
jgi:deferrochelatase/peroxidase EfeB